MIEQLYFIVSILSFCCRRRLSSQGTDPSESSGNMPRSASSRDGGDEYSSEASELDSAGSVRNIMHFDHHRICFEYQLYLFTFDKLSDNPDKKNSSYCYSSALEQV